MAHRTALVDFGANYRCTADTLGVSTFPQMYQSPLIPTRQFFHSIPVLLKRSCQRWRKQDQVGTEDHLRHLCNSHEPHGGKGRAARDIAEIVGEGANISDIEFWLRITNLESKPRGRGGQLTGKEKATRLVLLQFPG